MSRSGLHFRLTYRRDGAGVGSARPTRERDEAPLLPLPPRAFGGEPGLGLLQGHRPWPDRFLTDIAGRSERIDGPGHGDAGTHTDDRIVTRHTHLRRGPNRRSRPRMALAPR